MSVAMPARQVFGSLDGARLQSLQNTKNRQNGVPCPLVLPPGLC